MLLGISNTTVSRNRSWFPRLMVSWSRVERSAKPSVRALARFMAVELEDQEAEREEREDGVVDFAAGGLFF